MVALYVSRMNVPRLQQIATIEGLKTSSWIEIVYVSEELDAAAWILFVSRPDKSWSLVDCASFELMRQRGITTAFTSDHHFTQAGFLALL